jgi:hypothetical protein
LLLKTKQAILKNIGKEFKGKILQRAQYVAFGRLYELLSLVVGCVVNVWLKVGGAYRWILYLFIYIMVQNEIAKVSDLVFGGRGY